MIGIVCALSTIALVLVWIRNAIREHTREVRAIAEQEAEERRSRGLATGIALMDAMGKEANR